MLLCKSMFQPLARTGKFLSIKYVQPWGIALEFYSSEESSLKEELYFREPQFHAPIFSSEIPSRRLHHMSAPHYCILDSSQPEAFAKLCASLPDLAALKVFCCTLEILLDLRHWALFLILPGYESTWTTGCAHHSHAQVLQRIRIVLACLFFLNLCQV